MDRQPNDSLADLRVAIVQPTLAHYRVPVFDLLVRQTGIRLTVLCDRHPSGSLQSAEPAPSFRCEHSPMQSRGPFVSHPAMLEACQGDRFDAVVLTWNIRLLQLVPALLAARQSGKASVLWGHGYSKSDSRLRRMLRDAVVTMPDSVLLYGFRERERLIAAGWDPRRIFVAPNAIDQQPIRQAAAAWLSDPAKLDRWRREQRVEAGSLVVFISRVEPDKHVDALVRAFARVLDRSPDARLAVIGGGSALGEVRDLARTLGISGSVTFTGPLYAEEDVAPWCLSAACMAYPEAIGLSIQHAFGYGLPVVTGDDIPSHNPEIEALIPGINGILFRHRDDRSMADAITALLKDHHGRERWRTAALATVTEPDGFSIDRMVAGFREAIAMAVGRHTAQGSQGR
jgi:glycosyltransferase involved in cell wall biosynthesis